MALFRFRSRIAALAIGVAALLPLPCARADAPDYKLGDVAAADVVTPVRLLVVNPDATESLKQKLAQDILFIVRYTPQNGAEAEAALIKTIDTARAHFMTTLTTLLKGRAPAAADVGSIEYKATVVTIAGENPRNFPLEKLSALWVSGESDRSVVDTLVQPLRGVMSQPIVASKTDTPLPTNQPVRLVTVKDLDTAPTLRELQAPPIKAPSGQVLSLWRARRLVETSFPADQETTGRFVGGFVQINALADPAMTDAQRAQRMEGVTANDTYEAAQTIVRKGQVIDRKALAALTAMREKSLIGALQSRLDQEQTVAGQIQRQTLWIAAPLAAVCAILLALLWRLRTRPSTALVLGGQSGLSGMEQAALPGGAESGTWRSRALVAEGRAERAQAAIRSGVMGWMKEKIFQSLFHQRAELLSVQQRAEAEMGELEQRLEQLQTPLRDRIRAYEKRIEELERELVAKGEENRELIGARINVARQQLSVERERERAGFGAN